MENLNDILSKNLINLRKINSYTQIELASLLGYSDKTISKWETGEIIPSVENLIKLCKLYEVTLDQITSPMKEEEYKPKQQNPNKRNKIIITLLAILAVWCIATIAFVYSNILLNASYWMVFIWAVPVSCIVAIVFNSIWGNKKFGFIIYSVLLWSTITSVYLHFLKFNLFAIYFIGIPVQVALILSLGLRKQTKQKDANS